MNDYAGWSQQDRPDVWDDYARLADENWDEHVQSLNDEHPHAGGRDKSADNALQRARGKLGKAAA